MISLLDLPLTVVEDILEALCPHCTPLRTKCGRHCDCPGPCQTITASRSALASLCRTSKALRSMATPLLYHQPAVFDRERETIPLAQSLLRRPDLARHFRVLRHADAWAVFLEDGRSPGNAAAVDFFREVAKQSNRPDLPRNWLGTGRLLDLVASRCPALEELALQTYYDAAACGFSAPGSMACLRTLSLAHGDTELGCSMARIEPLLAAAPNLRCLKGTQVGWLGGEGVRMENVVELELEWCEVAADDLSSFLDRLPRLESFSYSAGGSNVSDSDGMLPRGFQTAVLLHAPRLRKLTLDLEMAFWARDLTEEAMLRSLPGLEQLEELAIDTRSLAVHQSPGLGRAVRMPDGSLVLVPFVVPEPDPALLVDLLPASIRKFRLRNGIGCGGPELALFVPAIVRLGEVAREKFPRLEAVAFPGLEESAAVDEARAVFETSGVSFALD